MTQDVTTLRHCSACGGPVDVDANFCPSCGTRQIDGVPREPVPEVTAPDPAPAPAAVAPEAASATVGWLVVAVLVMSFVLVTLALLTARVLTAGSPGERPAPRPVATATKGPAAAAMDRYAPTAAGWVAKHDHVADEGDGNDSAGLATAANDAHAWIDVNSRDLTAAASGVPGDSGTLYRQLIDIFARRYTVLADIETTATAGGTGPGAASGELAELDSLDRQADATVCAIADVMRDEGDNPADHITPAMNVVC